VIVASVYAAMLAKDLGADIFDNPKATGHGAEPGTSLMMHIVPHGMRMDLLEDGRKATEFAGLELVSPFAVAHANSQVNVYLDLHELTPNGAMANPDGASAEKGAAVMERIVDFVASFVDRFRDVDVRSTSGAVDHYAH
jgi:creatinine amidohydrolase